MRRWQAIVFTLALLGATGEYCYNQGYSKGLDDGLSAGSIPCTTDSECEQFKAEFCADILEEGGE